MISNFEYIYLHVFFLDFTFGAVTRIGLLLLIFRSLRLKYAPNNVGKDEVRKTSTSTGIHEDLQRSIWPPNEWTCIKRRYYFPQICHCSPPQSISGMLNVRAGSRRRSWRKTRWKWTGRIFWRGYRGNKR